MKPTKAFILAACSAIALCLPGCQHGYHQKTSFSYALVVSEIALSVSAPVDHELGLKLISVRKDGMTTIEDMKTKRRSSAQPGRPFSFPQLGASGLVLEKSSFSDQSATLSRYGCESSDQ